jgi:hypothetical protein
MSSNLPRVDMVVIAFLRCAWTVAYDLLVSSYTDITPTQSYIECMISKISTKCAPRFGRAVPFPLMHIIHAGQMLSTTSSPTSPYVVHKPSQARKLNTSTFEYLLPVAIRLRVKKGPRSYGGLNLSANCNPEQPQSAFARQLCRFRS